MPNTKQLLFVVTVIILFTLTLLGVFILMNKLNTRQRRLHDIEQRLQIQEQFYSQLLSNQQLRQPIQPAVIKDPSSHIVIMTPQKQKSKRESLLNKIYGFRTATAPTFPQYAVRPSAARPPSFLPMKETNRTSNPPAYTSLPTEKSNT